MEPISQYSARETAFNMVGPDSGRATASKVDLYCIWRLRAFRGEMKRGCGCYKISIVAVECDLPPFLRKRWISGSVICVLGNFSEGLLQPC